MLLIAHIECCAVKKVPPQPHPRPSFHGTASKTGIKSNTAEHFKFLTCHMFSRCSAYFQALPGTSSLNKRPAFSYLVFRAGLTSHIFFFFFSLKRSVPINRRGMNQKWNQEASNSPVPALVGQSHAAGKEGKLCRAEGTGTSARKAA